MKIYTRRISATDVTGTRVKASAYSQSRSIVRGWDHTSNHFHQDVALELAQAILGPDAVIQEVGYSVWGYTYEATKGTDSE